MGIKLSDLKTKFFNKKIFITGHTGFKGSWLLLTLSSFGANVKGYSLDPYPKNCLYNLIDGDTLCSSTIGDIRDSKALEQEILDFEPDYIFHMAAQPLVSEGFKYPLETFETNIIGTANLVNSLRYLKKSCSSVIITTDKVYDTIYKDHYYTEDDRLGGKDPYSASKACAELITSSIRESFFNINDFNSHKKTFSTVRSGNVIGGGDWSENRLIPDFVRATNKNEKVLLRNPNAIRPWQHVIDPILAYLLVAYKLDENPKIFSTSFNFGPVEEDCLKVSDVIEKCVGAWGSGRVSNDKNIIHFKESAELKLDINKSKSILGWSPLINVDEAIKLTIDWYKFYYLNPKEIKKFTTNQINEVLKSKI
jgi:CDP-glucose 4,6-dehydratase